MSASQARRERPRDAGRAREAILDAAEGVFAEHGFDGARIDAIAEAAGYNKSLLFHYFGDKLGLYTAVLKRADQQASDLQVQVFGSFSSDSAIPPDAFRAFVERSVRMIFDYFASHPRILRIYAWEEAEGWTTLSRISSQFDMSDVERFTLILARAQRAGVLRPDISPRLVVELVMDVCRTYITSLPLFQMMLPGADAPSATAPDALVRAREQIVAFIVHGLIADHPCRVGWQGADAQRAP